MLLLNLSIHISLIMRRSMLKYQEYLNSSPIMDVRNVWNWKRRSMVSVRVHAPSGSTRRRSWSKLVWISHPCLFFGDKVTCIICVEYLIFWAIYKDHIHNLEISLRELGVDLEEEDGATGFLGAILEQERNTGFIEMKKTGLIQRVIEAVRLDNGIVKGKFTLSDQRPLVKDPGGKPTSGMFRYSRIFGILLYLSGHTSTDIASTINFCGRYIFHPKRSHEDILKRLEQFLKHT